MKKSTKTSITTGVIIIVIGIVVLLCALSACGWNVKRVNEWQEDTFNATASVTRLNVKVNWGQVVVKRAATDNVSVKYEFDDRYVPKFEEKDGKLSIETSSKKWYEFNYWFENAPRLEITVPQELDLSEIQLTLNAGTVEFGDGEWCAKMSVKINAGTVTMGEISANEIDVKLNAGAFQAKTIDCDNISCKLNAGAFDVKEINCSKFDCKLNAGGFNVKKLDSSSSIKVDVSAGSANLGLVGDKSDYAISVSKSAGSCNVSSQISAFATRTLTVDLSAGSVDVSFGK